MRHSTKVPKNPFAFDLHVLSTPPAFVLSQDQTLQFDILKPIARFSFTKELSLLAPQFSSRYSPLAGQELQRCPLLLGPVCCCCYSVVKDHSLPSGSCGTKPRRALQSTPAHHSSQALFYSPPRLRPTPCGNHSSATAIPSGPRQTT